MPPRHGRCRGRLPRRPRSARSPAKRSPITSSCTTTPGRWVTATTCSSPSPLLATRKVPRPGYRAVMISTHCALEPWEGFRPRRTRHGSTKLGDAAHRAGQADLSRVWAVNAVVCEVATPRTYERFTRRPRGAVGGVRQTLANSNQHAIPHDRGRSRLLAGRRQHLAGPGYGRMLPGKSPRRRGRAGPRARRAPAPDPRPPAPEEPPMHAVVSMTRDADPGVPRRRPPRDDAIPSAGSHWPGPFLGVAAYATGGVCRALVARPASSCS